MPEKKRVLFLAQLTHLTQREDGSEEEELNPLERMICDWLEMNNFVLCVADEPAHIDNVFRSGAYRPAAVVGVGMWGVETVPPLYATRGLDCPAVVAFRADEWSALAEDVRQTVVHPRIKTQLWAGDDFRSKSPQKLRELLNLAGLDERQYR